jgi:hypothetical protein
MILVWTDHLCLRVGRHTINHLSSKEGAQCPTTAQLSEQFMQINPFRHRKMGIKHTKKQGKHLQVKKAEVL